MTSRGVVAAREVSALGRVLAAWGCLALAGCDWKVPQSVGPGAPSRETLVVIQNQDGEILGSKVMDASGGKITLSFADAAGAPRVSSKYLAVRSEPKNGKIGDLVAWSNTGAVSFAPPSNGAPLRAAFMNTADVPESVMDCYYGNFFGTGFRQVGRLPPGGAVPEKIILLDGDETIFRGAIDDLNTALIDRRGIALGQLSWDPASATPQIKAGFSDPAIVTMDWQYFFTPVWYVCVNPRDSRGNQTVAAVSGFLCADSCYANPCGQSVVDYLLDPAANYRLSRQGASLLRFGAYFNNNRNDGWYW